MVKVESRIEKRAAGATTKLDVATIKGKIVEFLVWMTNQGYHESSVKTYSNILKWLMRAGANLWDPESVKKAIAQKKWSAKTKAMAVGVYNVFARVNNLAWDPPKYHAQRKLPFIPLESEIDALIAGCGKKTSIVLQLLKETGMRIGEATALTWVDVDLERKTITVNKPEKAGMPRRIKISDKLLAMLKQSPKTTQRVLGRTTTISARGTFRKQRKRLATKLQNPRLLHIHFHTFRHWKATMEYHKTKDILHVKEMLGHKSIQSTLLYTQLIDFETDDDFHVKVAKNLEEDKELIEAGFQYVTERDSIKIYRKRK